MNEARRATKRNQAEKLKQRARKAADLLADVIEALPFSTDEDRTAMMAAIITALVCRSIQATPVVVLTAPMPGTGKTLAAILLSILATGEDPAVMSLGTDDAEFAKRLAGMILAGYQVILVDNTERPVAGDFICQASTSGTVAIRPLGVSQIVECPCRALIVITGNNVVIKGDLNRRVMKVHLDARMERPETRAFDGDLIGDVTRRRREIVEAALTVSSAYHAAGCPSVDTTPMGGFEAWDRLVRRPLVWAGYGDPLAPSMASGEDDPDRAAMRALFGAWWDQYGTEPITAARLADDATHSLPRFDGQGFELENAGLHEAVESILGTKVSARALGYVLRRYRDRIADGLQLEHAGQQGRNKAAAWRLVEL